MANLKLLHTADLHLGTTFKDLPEGLGGKSKERIEDYLRQLERIKEELVSGEYDFLIIAGDIFTNIRPDSFLFDEFAKFVRSVTQEEVKVITIAGNHDQPRVRNTEPYLKAFFDIGAPDFYFFRNPASVCLEGSRSKRRVRFVCLPYIPWQTLDPVEYTNMISRNVEELREVGEGYDYTIVVAHYYVEGAVAGSEHRLITFGDPPLPKSIFDWADMVCLGHMHRHQSLGENLVYSGSIERIDFGEADEEKGFVTIKEEGSKLRFEFKSLPCRPLLTFPKDAPLDLSKEPDPTKAIKSFIQGLSGIEGAIVRLRLKLSTGQNFPRGLLEQEMEAKGAFHFFPSIERIRLGAPVYVRDRLASVESSFKEYVEKKFKGSVSERVLELVKSEGAKILREAEKS